MAENTGSPRFTLNKAQGMKILKGAGYAAGGAVCAYLITVLPDMDFGPQSVAISAICSIVLSAGVKFFSGTK